VASDNFWWTAFVKHTVMVVETVGVGFDDIDRLWGSKLPAYTVTCEGRVL
jgi:hypothetical protein